jgi:hypothetical protein
MWSFATSNPGAVLCIVIVLAITVCSLWARGMRVLAVRKAGWPPPHLDADGDYHSPHDNVIEPIDEDED